MRRHDRHGRVRRADADLRHRPADGFRTGDRQRFEDLLLEAVGRVDPGLRVHLEGAEVHVDDVPDPDVPADPDDGVELAVLRLGTPHRPAALVVHRRALELRAAGRADLQALLRAAVTHAVQDALGLPRERD